MGRSESSCAACSACDRGSQVAPIARSDLKPKSDDGLPDDYEPVPKEEWISIRHEPDSRCETGGA